MKTYNVNGATIEAGTKAEAARRWAEATYQWPFERTTAQPARMGWYTVHYSNHGTSTVNVRRHHDPMTSPLYSTNDTAKRLGIDPSRVRRLAERYGIGQKIGPRAWVFTEADIDHMRAISTGKAGRPVRASPRETYPA